MPPNPHNRADPSSAEESKPSQPPTARLILDYADAPRPSAFLRAMFHAGVCCRHIIHRILPPGASAFTRMIRCLALICCTLAACAGTCAASYGITGLIYAITEAPARDRPGHLFAASLLTLLGLIILIFSMRWAFLIIRSAR